MKTTLRSLTAGRSPWETGLIAALALALLFSQISVSFVQSFLGIALVAWIVLLVRNKRRFAFPGFFWPLLVYAALSLVSSAFSRDPGMSFKDARMKIATLLLSLLHAEVEQPQETHTLVLPFSRQEISEILELSPETVSRTLSIFRRDQVLEAHGRRVTIRDVKKLQAAAHR